MKTEYKFILFSVLVITAVVLCALPFFAVSKNQVYIYTKQNTPNKEEENFIHELNKLGYHIQLNTKHSPTSKDVILWFRSPEFVAEIAKSEAQYNFIYSEEYYPFAWEKVKNYPIVLTPYQDLYEHYMRTNIKSALFKFDENSSKSAAVRFHQLLTWLKENKSN